MRLLRLPGVHRPFSDTWLLRDALLKEALEGAAVADLCCGAGALALCAASAGAAHVVAIDISRRATLAARMNASLRGCELDVRAGDMFGAIEGERFDVIVSNPPYVPAETDALPRHRHTTPLDGGRDGRALIDRLVLEGACHLRRGGSLLLVQSSVCGVERTLELLGEQGLSGEVVLRRRGPLGPVLTARAEMLRSQGLLGEADEEELVVLRGRGKEP